MGTSSERGATDEDDVERHGEAPTLFGFHRDSCLVRLPGRGARSRAGVHVFDYRSGRLPGTDVGQGNQFRRDVVGFTYTSQEPTSFHHAALYDGSSLIDLTPNWFNSQADAINDAGEIVEASPSWAERGTPLFSPMVRSSIWARSPEEDEARHWILISTGKLSVGLTSIPDTTEPSPTTCTAAG